MNTIDEPAEVVREADGEHLSLDIGGSRVYAELAGEVLVVRIHLAGGTPAAVYVDEVLVADSEMTWQPRGRHYRREESQCFPPEAV